MLDECCRQPVQGILVRVEDRPRLFVRLRDQRPDLLVDQRGDVVGIVGVAGVVAPEEDLSVRRPILHRSDLVAHPVLHDHLAGERSRLVDVVRSAGGRIDKDLLLGGAATEHHRQLVDEFAAAHVVAVLVRHGHRVSAGAAARDDRHLVDRIGIGQGVPDDNMPTLVIGGDLLVHLGHHPAATLGSGDDAIDRLVEFFHADDVLVVPGGQQRGLVDRVRQVGTGEPGGGTRQRFEVDALRQRLALGVHFENRPTPLDVRAIDHDLAVEPSRAKQGGVKDVGPVGGGDQDHPGLDIEAVHLDEQLVEGLLTLVMAATETSTAVATDGIDLVDEDDRRGLRLGLLEQVAHPAGADADEHLDEVRT